MKYLDSLRIVVRLEDVYAGTVYVTSGVQVECLECGLMPFDVLAEIAVFEYRLKREGERK